MYERIDFRVRAEVVSLADQARSSAYISTLSRGGLGMHSQQFLEVGTAVEMKIPARDKEGGQQIETIRGKVVQVHVGEAGNSYGIQFDQPLNAYGQPNLFAYLGRKTGSAS
jgi:hypothetical protein